MGLVVECNFIYDDEDNGSWRRGTAETQRQSWHGGLASCGCAVWYHSGIDDRSGESLRCDLHAQDTISEVGRGVGDGCGRGIRSRYLLYW